MENLKSILESLIFTAGKPIKISKLAKLLNLNEENIRSAVEDLQDEYQNSRRGIRLLIQSKAVQMVSAPEMGDYVKKLITDELHEELSRAALETLTIIAYRGPITRAEIEVIRGVNCVYILRSLLIRGLINKTKSEKDARMSLYEVSFDFLKHLGVKSVKELPRYKELHEKISFERFKEEKLSQNSKKRNDLR